MSVHDAKPNGIYADENGKLWRIIDVCPEPTVPNAPFQENLGAAQGRVGNIMPPASLDKQRKPSGIRALMWNVWERIFRNTKLEST